jgi:transitional endoplasmic reticulum ATPase
LLFLVVYLVRENVFIIAATNNINNIDPALRRSGRFDRVVEMSLPDKDSRFELLKYVNC